MRLMLPVALTVALLAGPAHTQPSGQPANGGAASAGTMPLSPNNCGTPDEPKPCTSHHAIMHPAAPNHHREPKGH